MPLPYTTLLENRVFLVRAELGLTSESQACLIQGALSAAGIYNDVSRRESMLDSMSGHFYTNRFSYSRQRVAQTVTSNFAEELVVNPGLCFQAFRTLAKSQEICLVEGYAADKLVLIGSFVTLRVVLYSIVPVLWYLQQDMSLIESQPRTALVTLDNELLTFMDTQLCFSQER